MEKREGMSYWSKCDGKALEEHVKGSENKGNEKQEREKKICKKHQWI